MCYRSAYDSGIRCQKVNPTLSSQGGAKERKLLMTNRKLFPARTYYRIIRKGALGDFDML
jgi:hypothetical protein